MPEINQYMFNNKELLELLIKHAHVHDGRWILIANFGFSPGHFGPTTAQVAPGVAIVINQMGIQRAQADTPKELWLDAAVVNPSSTAKNVD
jgi:hypothetical protein